MNQYSFLSENLPIRELVKDATWQQTRASLVGRWKRDPEQCCSLLRIWLGPVDTATDIHLKIMWNYLSSSGFRIGIISHPCITELKTSVRSEIIRRKMKFR